MLLRCGVQNDQCYGSVSNTCPPYRELEKQMITFSSSNHGYGSSLLRCRLNTQVLCLTLIAGAFNHVLSLPELSDQIAHRPGSFIESWRLTTTLLRDRYFFPGFV